MSNQGDPSTNPPHLPVHVFTNIGDQNNVISIKRFATTRKARIWVDQLEKERPGLYCITDEVEMDQSV